MECWHMPEVKSQTTKMAEATRFTRYWRDGYAAYGLMAQNPHHAATWAHAQWWAGYIAAQEADSNGNR